jgi:type IV secretory pathway TraG/TraD family ATPase VirD4
MFCSGIGDRATLEYLSHTLGDEEIARVATHRQSPLTPGSRTISSDFRALAAPNRIRQQNTDTALLIYGRLAPAWLHLRPWYLDAKLSALAASQLKPAAASRRRWRPISTLLRLVPRGAR